MFNLIVGFKVESPPPLTRLSSTNAVESPLAKPISPCKRGDTHRNEEFYQEMLTPKSTNAFYTRDDTPTKVGDSFLFVSPSLEHRSRGANCRSLPIFSYVWCNMNKTLDPHLFRIKSYYQFLFVQDKKPEEFTTVFPRCETPLVDLTEDDYMVSKQKCFRPRELGLNVFVISCNCFRRILWSQIQLGNVTSYLRPTSQHLGLAHGWVIR